MVLEAHGELWRSRVRWSSLGDLLLVHSAWPTDSSDAVFFGPDSYRFAQLIEDHLRLSPRRHRLSLKSGNELRCFAFPVGGHAAAR